MSSPSGSVAVRWLSSSEAAMAERIWKQLESRLGGRGLACSWLWTGTWLEHYGDLVPHRFAVGEVAGTECGIALVTNGVQRRRGPFRVRSVHIGTAGEPPSESVYVEYNRLLVEPQRRAGFAAALLSELRRDAGWHELTLDGFVPEDAEPFLAAELRLESRRQICATTDLRKAEATGGDVSQILRSSTRKKLRRSFRALGEVRAEWAETPEEALEILEELVQLHQARWTRAGHRGVFASPRVAGFHRALVRRLAATGGVVLFRASAASGTVGCEYGFVEGDRVLLYQSGLAEHSDRQVRPGFVADVLCMQCCYERGFSEYDFLAGESIYKRQLSTDARELVWATWRRPAVRWQVIDALAKVRRRARAVRAAVTGPTWNHARRPVREK
jgi:CelD/BcsL family acetyltransferase involved in cellulose biosynthesis